MINGNMLLKIFYLNAVSWLLLCFQKVSTLGDERFAAHP